MIRNKVNGKKYIGQSVDIEKRFYEHKRTLRKNKHNNEHLQRAWNKYGESKFEFKIIHDNISNDEINNWELYYINEIYNTYIGEGYNQHIGGDVMRGKCHPNYGKKRSKVAIKLTSEKVKENNNPKAKITLENARDIMNEFKYSDVLNIELAEKYDVKPNVISEIINGHHWTCEYLEDEFTFDGTDSLYQKERIKRRMKALLEYTKSEEGREQQSKIRGSKNPASKVTEEMTNNILYDRKYNNITTPDLCDKYNLCPRIIGQIVSGKHWIYNEIEVDYNLNTINYIITEETAQEIWDLKKKQGLKYSELYDYYNGDINIRLLEKICQGIHPLCDYIDMT